MKHELSDSLVKFKELVEKDLTGLAAAWSLVSSSYGDLAVKALLLEKRCRSSEYSKVGRVVDCLEGLTGYPGMDTDFLPLYKKAVAHRKKLLKGHMGGVKSQVTLDYFFCRVAGAGNYTRGQHLLGIKALGEVTCLQQTRELEHFLSSYGEGSQLLLDCNAYLANSGYRMRSMAVTSSGVRTDEEVAYFTDLCIRVFLHGKRVNILEMGRYSNDRRAYRELLGRYKPGQLAEASRVLSPLCRYVHISCFGPIEKDIVEGLSPLSTYVLDRIAKALPSVVYNYLHTSGPEMPEPVMPTEDMQVEVMDELAKIGRPLSQMLTWHQGRSVLSTRYDHVDSHISVHAGRLDKSTLGLKGRLDVLGDNATAYSFTAKELQSYSWFLAPKDLALLKLIYIDGVRQRDAAAATGITQGAVSHRLIRARATIRLLSGMGRMPNEMEIAALVHTYFPEETKGLGLDPVLILMAMANSRGKQVEAAVLAGVGQPTISTYLKRYNRYLIGQEITADHKRAADFVRIVHKYPYAFQDVELPHFPWNKKAVADNQIKPQKKKGVRK